MYENSFKETSKIAKDLKGRTDLKQVYFDFLKDFKNYLKEYIKESVFDTSICEIPIGKDPVKLYNDDYESRQLILKNQGQIECFLSTNGKGGFRLDPGEKEHFWLNKQLTAVTISGNTVLGMIKT